MTEIFSFSLEELTAIRLSLRVALWATIWSLPFGLAAALLLARGRFWGQSLLNVVVHLPLVLPPVVTGYVLLLLFGRRGPIGHFLAESFGIVFAFRWTGAALACARIRSSNCCNNFGFSLKNPRAASRPWPSRVSPAESQLPWR